MPGVPSYRGCDACRKQKKKCDQAKPLCSRCSRLGIECIGSGQQRYKFKDQTVVFTPTSAQLGQIKTKTKANGDARPARRRLPVVLTPSQPLSNDLTSLTGAFVSMLKVTDPRYDLYCYGNFLAELPARLGKNAALDAAVDVVTSGFTCVRTRHPTQAAVSKYVSAIKALRSCLDDPATTTTPETLTAVYLIMICQGWIGGENVKYLGHGQAMSHILSAAANSGSWRGSFERKLIITLSTVVILESIFNDEIKLDPWLPKLAALTGPIDPVESVEDFDLMGLAHIPQLFKYPDENIARLTSSYQWLRAQCPQLRETVEKLDEPGAVQDMIDTAGPLGGTYFYRIQTRAQTTYGLLLVSALVYNRYLREADPEDEALAGEGMGFVQDVIDLANLAYPRLPCGAGYMPFCLMSAWCVAEDALQKLEIQALLVRYRYDLMHDVGKDCVVWMSRAIKKGTKKMADARRSGLCDGSLSEQSGSTSSSDGSPTEGGESCCIL